MLKSIHIQRFKRFSDLKIPEFKRVNLIAGRNNVGKTALLEAVLLLLDGRQQLAALPQLFRNAGSLGDEFQNFWRWIFAAADSTNPVLIEGQSSQFQDLGVLVATGASPGSFASRGFVHSVGMSQLSLFVRHQVEPNAIVFPQEKVIALSVRQSDSQADAAEYDRVVLKKGAEERLEQLLRTIEPRLQSLRSIKPYGASLIYADVGLQERIPVVHLGQGFNRLLSIYAGILASGKDVLLIDEIENGLHHEILPQVWRGVRELAESEGVQVFATTHSWECVSAAHEAFAETMNYDFALHRLVEVGGDIQAQTLDREALEASMKGLIDVR